MFGSLGLGAQVISLAAPRFLHTGNSSDVVEVIGQELLYRNIDQNVEAQTKNITKRRGQSVECGIRLLQYVLRSAVGGEKNGWKLGTVLEGCERDSFIGIGTWSL